MFELSFYAPIDVRHNYQQSPADVLKKRRPEKFIEFSEKYSCRSRVFNKTNLQLLIR